MPEDFSNWRSNKTFETSLLKIQHVLAFEERMNILQMLLFKT